MTSAELVETNLDPLLTQQEAAAYLKCQPSTLQVWRCTGRVALPFVKVGRRVRYRKSALDAFLAANTREVTA